MILGTLIKDFHKLVRMKQWIKNVFVFAPLFFSWKFTQSQMIFHSVMAFFAFSFTASLVYIINDIHDRDADSMHPKKKYRPIASGRVSIRTALVIGILFFALGMILGWYINNGFILFIIAYIALHIFYTYKGKNMVIVDAFCIAMGFVLRVMGGAYAITVEPSGWIIMTTFFLTLFLGFGKRRNELISLKENSGEHRKVLYFYTNGLLDQFILSSGTLAMISYALYTLSDQVKTHFHTNGRLVYTIPFVTFFIFRYIYLLWTNEEGDPTDVVMKDPWIILCGLAWAGTTFLIIYISLKGII